MIEIKNAQITDINLGYEGHGILTAYLTLDLEGGGGAAFGGYNLSGEYCSMFIKETIDTVEVDSWEAVKGKIVKAMFEDDRIVAIGNVLKNKWFNPKEYFDSKNNKS